MQSGEIEISGFEKEKIEKRKSEKDPLRDVDRYLKIKKDKDKKKSQKRKRSNDKESHVKSKDSNEDKLQRLREERLMREKEERKRAEELLMKYKK